jgi:uncharacterized protein YkwD
VHQVQLAAAAEAHSQDMAVNGYFDHVSPGGSDPLARVIAQGYDPAALAENIAAGHASAQATFGDWQNSADHNANMLDPGVTETGIGRAYNPNAPYTWYWTNVFASPA